MSTDDRIARLEQRVAVLEKLVRQLVSGGVAEAGSTHSPESGRMEPMGTKAPVAEEAPATTAPGPLAPAASARSPSPWLDSLTREPLPPGSSGTRPRTSAPPGSGPTLSRDAEQWLGQRGLLAIGVLFVILAAGYLLKYSFDRGWVSPLVRCVSGAFTGIVIGAVGWRLHDRGLRTYGAALVGCGAAVIYIAVWAATYLYRFLPPPEGIAGLALVSLSLGAIAYAIDLEALGATAVLGAFLAPVLLGEKPVHAELLLLYLGCMAAALGWVAARKRWRLTSALIATSYFGLSLASGAADQAEPWWVLVFGVLGGSAGLYVGLRDSWWETRFLCFTGGWTLIGVASDRLESPWAVLLAGIALAAPVWGHALRASTFWPLRRAEKSATPWSIGETLYFFVTPILLGWAVSRLDPELFRQQAGLAAAIVALPYLLAGFSLPRAEFALVGTTAAGYAALGQWSGLEATWALLLFSLIWAGLDHPLRRSDGRWYGLLALGAALTHLVLADGPHRPAADPAFVDRWALTLWGAIGALLVMARGLWRRLPSEPEPAPVPTALWTVAGVLLFFGVTQELPRFFGARGYSAETAGLVRGESIVVWWLVFFGALLVLGTLRALRPARLVGALGLLAAVGLLGFIDLAVRGDLDHAFWGLWAGALWMTIAVLAGLATWLQPRLDRGRPMVSALWIGAGALLLLGVTGELDRFFAAGGGGSDTAALASGLSISAWWILFAGSLVLLGFRRDLKAVRQAGLLVAAMAAVKILVHDLSTLNALYRVASVFFTGLISLLLAYLYNREARES